MCPVPFLLHRPIVMRHQPRKVAHSLCWQRDEVGLCRLGCRLETISAITFARREEAPGDQVVPIKLRLRRSSSQCLGRECTEQSAVTCSETTERPLAVLNEYLTNGRFFRVSRFQYSMNLVKLAELKIANGSHAEILIEGVRSETDVAAANHPMFTSFPICLSSNALSDIAAAQFPKLDGDPAKIDGPDRPDAPLRVAEHYLAIDVADRFRERIEISEYVRSHGIRVFAESDSTSHSESTMLVSPASNKWHNDCLDGQIEDFVAVPITGAHSLCPGARIGSPKGNNGTARLVDRTKPMAFNRGLHHGT